MEKSLQRVQAAIVDGRSRTPRYIQKQLTILHDALVRIAPSISQAIIQDSGCTSAEAWIEIYMTLKAVKAQFTAIDFKDTLQQEYSLARSKDNLSRRSAYGCVYVVAPAYSRFYSTIQPVAAAIAAGNCVVIEMRKTLREVERLLRSTLNAAMDKDTFAIIDQRPSSDKFFTAQVVVISTDPDEQFFKSTSSAMIKTTSRRVVAVVDRSANIVDAAKQIVRARVHFRGASPYAPDVVLVNEFAVKEFCQAAVRFLTEDVSTSVTSNGATERSKLMSDQTIQKDLEAAGTVTLISGARGSIHLLKERHDSILNRKINEPILVINTISSLDDAIDASNVGDVLLATYFFADPAATKYLSQFIFSDVSFSNHIPSQLLIGPAAPKGFPISVDARFTTEMFSIPAPEYIVPKTADQGLLSLLDNPPSKASLDKLKSEIQTPLPDMGEPTTTTIGYFEQGIITGLGMEATVLLGLIGTAAWYTVPAVVRKLRS